MDKMDKFDKFEKIEGANNVNFDLDEVPMRDNEHIFASDHFNKMYNQHVRIKENIRNNLESITREKAFLEQMKPSDMVYMFQKKKEF